MKRIVGCFIVVLLFVSCKTQNLFVQDDNLKDSTTFAYDADYQYKIRKDDKISISVWGEDDLSVGSTYGIYNSNEVYGKWLLVDANGTIEIPKIGTTAVVGKTLPELKDYLKIQLKKWLVNPIVDVKVLNKEVTILGEVKNPNIIQVDKDHVSLLEMISKTGGFDFYANLKSVKIVRQQDEKVSITNLDLTQSNDIRNTNIFLHPGDIVIVPSKKNKEFDKRVSSIIPLTSAISTAAIIMKLF